MEPTGYTPGQDVTLDRLEDQLDWYSRKSGQNKRAFRGLKVCTVIAAAFVPAVAISSKTPWLTSALGLLITVIEGLQQLYQFQANWISYRSISEALKHEKYLYLAKAGPYAAATDPHTLLAERVESLVSQENSKWALGQEKAQQAASAAAAKTP